MKTTFIFDTILIEEQNDYYGMTLNYDFFKSRYLPLFDSMVITTRSVKREQAKGNTSGYKIVNGHDVTVRPIVSYNEIPDAVRNRKKILSELDEIIRESDKVIIRMPSVLGILAIKVCKKHKKDYLVELVACPWDGYRNHTNPIGKILAPIMFSQTKKIVWNAPNVLYVTQEFLQKRYPTKGRACGCSDVIINTLDDNKLEERLHKIQDLDANSLVLGTVANVGMKYKGHKYVLEAMAILKEKGKKIKYHLIGNGDSTRLKDIVNKLGLENDVVFHGSLQHDEVFRELEKIDLYIQPSLQEGLPRSVVEAMSLGCPVIGSNVGGMPELISQSMIFEKKNTFQLVDLLEKITIDDLLNEARRNFNKAKEFEDSKLSEIRSDFYTSF